MKLKKKKSKTIKELKTRVEKMTLRVFILYDQNVVRMLSKCRLFV